MKKRILIDCRNLSYPGSGLCSYCEGVIAEFSVYADSFDFVFLVEDENAINRLQLPFNYSVIRSTVKKSNTLLRDIDEQIILPFRLLFKHIDVFHGFDFYVPALPSKYKKISTIHDCAAFRDLVNGSIRTKYRCFLQRLASQSADKIVTISEFSKKEIVSFHHVSEENVIVANNGIKDVFYKPVEEETLTRTLSRINGIGNYILYYGGYRKNKNVEVLLDAFNRIDGYSLVMTGSKDAVSALLDKKKIPRDRVLNWGFATDEEIKCLLDNCAVFVFPSSYEGFGLPVAEALSRGARVICNDIEVLREVAKEDAEYFKGEDELVELLNNVAGKREPNASRYFSYKTAVEQIINIYNTL